MGCNCIFECSTINNDITLEISSNQYYKTYKKKNKDEIIIRAIIDDYKALNKNATKLKFKKKNIEENNFKKIKFQKNYNNVQRISNKEKSKLNNDTIKVQKKKSVLKYKKISKNAKAKVIKLKKSHPEAISYLKDVTKDSFSYFYLDNTFLVFNSIFNILTIIYGTKEKSIVSYDLIENQKINEIKNAHNELITNFRYIYDIKNKRDLVISLSYDNNIKLWNYNNLDCLTSIENIYKSGYLFSASFLNDNNILYIITSNYSENNESLKVYDLTGHQIKEINDSFGACNFLDIYYDKKNSKNYIITGNIGCVKSFDYENNKLYHIYSEDDCNDHISIKIIDRAKEVKMIESSGDCNIRIWNFHRGELLKKINVYNIRLFGICLWNNDYLFVGCEDKTIKLIEIKTGDVANNLFGKNNEVVLNIKKIKHPKFGECLISQGFKNNQIKLWVKKIKTKKKK